MASDETSGNPSAKAGRHVYGPRPVGALVPAIARPAFRRRAPAAAQVLADWPAIVGPALAGVTMPRRLTGGTLTIACDGPVAMELQHLADAVIARINVTVGGQSGGRPLVERLRFVQEALPRPAASPPKPPPRAVAAAARAVADLPPGPLRDALQALGEAVLTPG
jgi:hypothetical protein